MWAFPNFTDILLAVSRTINRIQKLATLALFFFMFGSCSAVPADLSELSQFLTPQAPNVTLEIKPVTNNQEPTLAAQATKP